MAGGMPRGGPGGGQQIMLTEEEVQYTLFTPVSTIKQ
jgi:hypothetical protein